MFRATDENEREVLAALDGALAQWLDACAQARFVDAVPLDVAREAWLSLLEEPSQIRVIGRRIDNVGSLPAQGGQTAGAGFPVGEWLRLRLLADGGKTELAINERVVLTGQDDAQIVPGAVGFFCRGADRARFRHFRLSSL